MKIVHVVMLEKKLTNRQHIGNQEAGSTRVYLEASGQRRWKQKDLGYVKILVEHTYRVLKDNHSRLMIWAKSNMARKPRRL